MIVDGIRGSAFWLGGLFLVFLVDAALFPFGPEISFVAVVLASKSAWIRAAAVGASLLGEVIGTSIQYALVRGQKGRFFERALRRLGSYLDLVRAASPATILWNRVVPVVPCMGAAIYIRRWPLARALGLVAFGGLLKYGALAVAVSVAASVAPRGVAAAIFLSLAGAWIAFNLAREWRRRYRQTRAGHR
jgi:membrane protein YqaA with SNARE-associated domain